MSGVKLKLGGIESYDPDNLKNFTEKELRAEYTRLRDIAVKREKRLRASEFAGSQAQRALAHCITPLKNITSEAQLRAKLSDLARVTSRETSSITGLKKQRAEAVRSLNERGYGFVTVKNFKEFTEFMDKWRSDHKGRRIGSPTPEELQTYMWADSKKIKPEELEKHFEFYLENIEKLEKVNLPKGKRKNAKAWREALMRLEE